MITGVQSAECVEVELASAVNMVSLMLGELVPHGRVTEATFMERDTYGKFCVGVDEIIVDGLVALDSVELALRMAKLKPVVRIK